MTPGGLAAPQDAGGARSDAAAAPPLFCTSDLDGRLTAVSPAWTRTLGWSAAELCAQPLLDFVHPDDAADTRAAFALLTLGGDVADFVNRWRCRAGGYRWLAWTASADTAAGLIFATAQDATDRHGSGDDAADVAPGRAAALRRQEARLVDAERRAEAARAQLEAAVEVLDAGFVLYDAEDRLALCNSRYREIYAESAPAIVEGARFEDVLRYGLAHGQYPDATGREDAWLAERMTAHRHARQDLLQRLPGDRWLRIVERCTPDGGRVGLRTDVTALKRAERRLAELIRGAEVGTWEWDLRSGRVFVNDRLAQMLGHAPGEMGAMTADAWARLTHPEDAQAAAAQFEACFKGVSEFYSCETRLRARDGGWVWVLERGSVSIRGADGRPLRLSGLLLDVTKRKSAELALAEALRVAEDANEAKSQFLANMSHEIRTPLTSVIGFTRLLRDQPELSAASARFVDRALAGCDALLATVNDILDFSKLEAGEITVARRSVDPRALLGDCLEMLRPRAAEKGLALAAEGLEGLPAALLIDPDRVRQIALNLLGNAVKFTETGAVTLIADHDAAAARLTVQVRDTGPGIAPADQPRLFRRFSQIDGSNTRRHGGTGLGLAICRGLAERMDGGVACDSAPGAGATFRFWLRAPACAAAGAAPGAPGARSALTGLRVLVADDVEANRVYLGAVVEAAGGQAELARDGAALMAAASRRPFDVILIDWRMPDLDGLEAAAALRARPGPNQCSALILVSADIAARSAAQAADVDGVLLKPASAAEVLAAVAAALGDDPDAVSRGGR